MNQEMELDPQRNSQSSLARLQTMGKTVGQPIDLEAVDAKNNGADKEHMMTRGVEEYKDLLRISRNNEAKLEEVNVASKRQLEEYEQKVRMLENKLGARMMRMTFEIEKNNLEREELELRIEKLEAGAEQRMKRIEELDLRMGSEVKRVGKIEAKVGRLEKLERLFKCRFSGVDQRLARLSGAIRKNV